MPQQQQMSRRFKNELKTDKGGEEAELSRRKRKVE